MKEYKVIIFDLDGTLSKSGEGITKSLQYALEKVGIKEDDLDFFPDFCDLKINILYDSKILLESDDFFIFNNNKKTYKKGNKFYINIKDLNELEIIKLSEFCKIKYCWQKVFLKLLY